MLLRSCALACAVAAVLQTPVRIHVIDRPRPVSEAVRQIEKAFGFVVSYEDTSYVHPDDVIDITSRVRRDGDLSKRVFGMRSGSIDMRFVPRAQTPAENVEGLLLDMVRRSRLAGNTGDFRVACARRACHVIPIAVRGVSGQRETYAPLLDTRVSLQPGTVRGSEFLRRVTSAVAHASGRRLSPGIMPTNMMLQRTVTIDSQPAAARDLLAAGLRSMSPRLSWQLLCAAGEGAGCALNVHLVDLNGERLTAL